MSCEPREEEGRRRSSCYGEALRRCPATQIARRGDGRGFLHSLSGDAARDRLKALSSQLTRFLAGSEGVFLDVGSRVTGLERRARGLVDVSQGAVSRGAAAGPQVDPVQHLDRELGSLERYLGASRDASGAGLEGLLQILDGAEAIQSARGGCEDLTRTLRVLGIYTRIENARESRSVGMETVVAEVRRLGDVIDSKFQAMLGEALGLGETAASARATAESFRRRQGAWSAQVLDETRSALASLRALAASQSAVAARALSTSAEVVSSATDVLVALQTHDSTRQMIEHAVEALDAFERDAGGPEGAGEAELAELCRLVTAQLRAAREQLVGALGHIAGSLGAMASRVTGLGEETGRLAGSGVDASPLERVEQGVGQATAALREHLSHEQAMTAAVGRVAATAQGIATYVRDIRGIGSAVKIIALNALVETERTGAGGEVLAVLAQEIGVLAVEVVARTTAVSRTLETIERAAGALGSGGPAREVEDGAALADDLEGLVTRLRAYHGELEASAAALRDGSGALRGEVEGLSGRLAEQIAAAGALERIEEELGRLGVEAAAAARRAGTDARPLRQSSLLSRYTMEAERAIHERVLGAGGATDTRLAPADAAGEGLGDNVELF